MDKFDEKIIGYEATKNILRQILDTLKRPELYKSKGASIPRGLLMESDPGLGKSLLATVFIKESGRKSLVFRKTSQENSFLDELRAAFLAAKEAAPSILLLKVIRQSSLNFNDKSSEFLFVEVHCTLRQGSQISFVVTSGQKSRPGKNIGSIPQRTIERQAKQLAFVIAGQCDL